MPIVVRYSIVTKFGYLTRMWMLPKYFFFNEPIFKSTIALLDIDSCQLYVYFEHLYKQIYILDYTRGVSELIHP